MKLRGTNLCLTILVFNCLVIYGASLFGQKIFINTLIGTCVFYALLYFLYLEKNNEKIGCMTWGTAYLFTLLILAREQDVYTFFILIIFLLMTLIAIFFKIIKRESEVRKSMGERINLNEDINNLEENIINENNYEELSVLENEKEYEYEYEKILIKEEPKITKAKKKGRPKVREEHHISNDFQDPIELVIKRKLNNIKYIDNSNEASVNYVNVEKEIPRPVCFGVCSDCNRTECLNERYIEERKRRRAEKEALLKKDIEENSYEYCPWDREY